MERTTLATLSGSGPEERLEVVLVRGPDGRVALDLREQHYAEGVGWFDQRSLTLAPRQLRELQGLLGGRSAGGLLDRVERTGPVILPFPGPRDETPLRQAAGGEG